MCCSTQGEVLCLGGCWPGTPGSPEIHSCVEGNIAFPESIAAWLFQRPPSHDSRPEQQVLARSSGPVPSDWRWQNTHTHTHYIIYTPQHPCTATLITVPCISSNLYILYIRLNTFSFSRSFFLLLTEVIHSDLFCFSQYSSWKTRPWHKNHFFLFTSLNLCPYVAAVDIYLSPSTTFFVFFPPFVCFSIHSFTVSFFFLLICSLLSQWEGGVGGCGV